MLLHLGNAVAGDERLQVGELIAEPAAQVDNSLRRDDAVAGALRSAEVASFMSGDLGCAV